MFQTTAQMLVFMYGFGVTTRDIRPMVQELVTVKSTVQPTLRQFLRAKK